MRILSFAFSIALIAGTTAARPSGVPHRSLREAASKMTPSDSTLRVLLLHGIMSSGATWDATVPLLNSWYPATTVVRPDLPWQWRIESQLAVLPTTGPNTVLVGHSQGGVLARRHAQSNPVQGFVTLGSALQGAPFADQLNHQLFAAALWGTVTDVSGTLSKMYLLEGVSTALNMFQSEGDWVLSNFPYVTVAMAEWIFDVTAANTIDMATQSDFMKYDLNGPGAYSQEYSNTGGRGNFAYYVTAADAHDAMFWRLIFSTVGGQVFGFTAGYAIGNLLGQASYHAHEIAIEADDEMWDALYDENRYWALNELFIDASFTYWDLMTFDDEYCWDVSTYRWIDNNGQIHGNECQLTDGFIPVWSQSSFTTSPIFAGFALHTEEIPNFHGLLAEQVAHYTVIH